MYAKDIKVIKTYLTSETSKSTDVKRDFLKKGKVLTLPSHFWMSWA